MCDIIEIGDIGNYYGGLQVKAGGDGNFWWGIENYNGTEWSEIPESLYIELIKYNESTE